MKLPSDYIWQWILVIAVVYIMINGIDFMFGKKLMVDDNNVSNDTQLEETIDKKVDKLQDTLNSILKELQELNQTKK